MAGGLAGFALGPAVGIATTLASILLPLLLKGGKAAKHVASIFGTAAKHKKHAKAIGQAIKGTQQRVGARTPIFGPGGRRTVGAGRGQQFAPHVQGGGRTVEMPMLGGGSRTASLAQAVEKQRKYQASGRLGIGAGTTAGLAFTGLAAHDIASGSEAAPTQGGPLQSAMIPELGMTEDEFLQMLMEQNPELGKMSRGLGDRRSPGMGGPPSGGAF